MDTSKMIFGLVGGLGLFMLGMKYMSDGLQAIAGNRLRSLIGAVTGNRVMATTVGCIVTAIVQSSSVTTVMVVGFVNAGFMTLVQAVGVIMGANIGTTVTGWLLVLPISKWGLPILGVSALVYRFSTRERWRYIAMTAMGLGMIFFGLQLMKDGMKPLREMEAFCDWFAAFQATTYLGVLKCAMVGCVLTMVVQSSSATLVITIGLATTGVIPFTTAAALVLGENIGTTITAYLASIGTTTNAKRAAYAHVIFNIVGVIWITALFVPYMWLIEWIYSGVDFGLFGEKFAELTKISNSPDEAVSANAAKTLMSYSVGVTAAIATVHTIFNVVNTVAFLPFTKKLADFLTRVVPDKAHKETPHLTQLDGSVIGTPAIGIAQVRAEIVRMSEIVDRMLARVKEILTSKLPSEKMVKKVFDKEEVMDIMQKEVTIFLTGLLSGSVALEIADEGRRLLRMADEYESVSDYAANLVKLRIRLDKAGVSLSEEDTAVLARLHDDVVEYVDMVSHACATWNVEIIAKAHARGDGLSHSIREARDSYLKNVTERHVDPLTTVIYTDMLNAYRRVKDHAMNVAEALAGEK